MSKDVKTPMLDDLEKGAWPSFVKEIKTAAKKSKHRAGPARYP